MPEIESFSEVYVFTVHITIVITLLKILVSQICGLEKYYLDSYIFSFLSLSLAGEKNVNSGAQLYLTTAVTFSKKYLKAEP